MDRFRDRVINWPQFAMLAVLTAFTGSVIGLEQPILPLLGHSQFHLASNLALLSFLVSFGNLTRGSLSLVPRD